MKHLLTLTVLLLTFSGLAQQMPYNPDANGDDFVGVDDVLGVLGVYDTALMQPDLECDYEGTDLEQLVGGLLSGSLILDSLYIEYLLVDSVITYFPECPDPVAIETVLERSYMFTNINNMLDQPNPGIQCYQSFYGYTRNLILRFYPDNGKFKLYLEEPEVFALTAYPNVSRWNDIDEQCCIGETSLPFPDSWELNEDGIQVDWYEDTFIHNAQNFRMIPFWHEAE